MNTKALSTRAKFSRIYSKFGILFVLILEIAIFGLSSANFITFKNLLTVGRQVSFTGISAVGVAMIMITGGIDISTGMLLALSGVFCANLNVNLGVPLGWAIAITMIGATIFGIICGEITARLRVPALITTLAFQTIYKGLAFFITDAVPIYGISDFFKSLGQGYLFEVIPIPLIIMLVAFAIGWFIMEKTYIGRYIYAVGGNEEAARLSGINTKRIIVLTFALCAFFTSVSGIMMVGRLGSGQPGTGVDFPMDVITAVVVGGVSVSGGKGKILLVIVGALMMGMLDNGMTILGVNPYLQWVIKGLVLIFAVTMSSLENIDK